jgi:hypothetical protein
MAMIHLVFVRSLSPLLFLLLLSGHLLLNKQHTCFAIRLREERGNIFDWETLVDKRVKEKAQTFDDELLPESLRQLDEQNSLNQPIKTKSSDVNEIEGSIDNKHLSDEPWIVDGITGRAERLQSNPAVASVDRRKRRNDTLFLIIVGICCAVGVIGLITAAIFWYKIQKRAKGAGSDEYPSYGVTGPNSNSGKISPSATMSDRKLAQSAQMFHYQQQRQQMMAQEKAHLDAKPVHSDDSDDETPAGGDYTVYECPGLAPTGEMEVRNPLFAEPDSSLTSAALTSHPTTNNHYPQPSTSISSSPPKEKSLP